MTGDLADTDELLNRAGRGDVVARDELLARHRPRLRRMVSVWMDDRLRSRIDPSDVIQESLIVAARRLPDYLRQRPISFYPWLRRVTWNCLVDLHRTHLLADKRTVLREEPLGLSATSAMQLADRFIATGTGPLKRLLREELRAQVRSVMARLSATDHQILLLRHLEQLTTAQCAETLDITEAAAKQRHVRAVRRLQTLLNEISGEL